MEFIGRNRKVYRVGKSIGRGGEGEVFEVLNEKDLLLKVYHEVPSKPKEEKLQRMVEVWRPEIDRYAAWPSDVCVNVRGQRALIIRKLTGCVALHRVFTPMDRKRFFPDKGYNFLIHIAYNLSVALAGLHNQGIVIGDINESNILVDKNGLVYFIDCDSFQLSVNGSLYPCEVGVPRYTAPEILREQSFRDIRRTPNSDNFSLAVLVFQLLFLGKHPFSGAPVDDSQVNSEEDAILQKEFPYSKTKASKKLKPPKGALPIDALPIKLSGYFHVAFEAETERPVATAWAAELKDLLNGLKICSSTKIHIYPSSLLSCPWCGISKQYGITYFLDDSLVAREQENTDIDSFINGFKIEQLKVIIPSQAANVVKTISKDFDTRLKRKTTRLNQILVVSSLVFLVLILLSPLFSIGVVSCIFLLYRNPGSMRLKQEIEAKRQNIVKINACLSRVENDNHSISEVKLFNDINNRVASLITSYMNLNNERQKKEQSVEEIIYNEQLRCFLCSFDIKNATIPNFGEHRKRLLINNAITTAADIPKLRKTKIDGIGPSLQGDILGWYNQVKTRFNYKRDINLINREIGLIRLANTTSKSKLKQEILSEAGRLPLLKSSALIKIQNHQDNLLRLKQEISQLRYDVDKYRSAISLIGLFKQ